jgi:hypothetical protein
MAMAMAMAMYNDSYDSHACITAFVLSPIEPWIGGPFSWGMWIFFFSPSYGVLWVNVWSIRGNRHMRSFISGISTVFFFPRR